jgi:hypothetical protein
MSTPDEPKPTSKMNKKKWMGCLVREKSDGGFEIVLSNSTVLMETEDLLRTMMKPSRTSSGQEEVIRDDEFVQFEMLGRCRFLVEGIDKSSSQKTNKKSVADLLKNLNAGQPLNPYAHSMPYTNLRLKAGIDLSGMLQDDQKPKSTQNRPLSEVTCNADLLVRHDQSNCTSGFTYSVPCTEALEYPAELLSMLKDFALQHVNDILPLRCMLLAYHLWTDIMDSHDLRLERYLTKAFSAGSNHLRVPDVSLAAFIIYFPHWIKWPECMGLAEYPHPFRFVNRAMESDLVNQGIGVDAEKLDEERAYALMSQITTRVPLMDTVERVSVMPHSMPGSRMPPMFGADTRHGPEAIPLALTGLVNVNFYGLASYARPKEYKTGPNRGLPWVNRQSRYVSVGLPKFVNEAVFTAPGKPVGMPQVPSQGHYVKMDHMRPYWKPNNARHIAGPSFEKTSLDLLEWNYRLEDYVPASILSRMTMTARLHYQKLTKDGHVSVNGRTEMVVGPNLFWTPRNMRPITQEDLERPPERIIYGPDAARRSPTPSVISLGSRSRVTFALSPEPPREIDSPHYENLLEAWTRMPEKAHWSWKEGLVKLRDLPVGSRTEIALRKLVTEAVEGEARDVNTLSKRLMSMGDMDPLTDNDLLTIIPLAFGRLLGLEPPSATLVDVWNDHFMQLAADHRAPEAICVLTILGHLKTVKYAPRMIDLLQPEVHNCFDKLKSLMRDTVPADWFGGWKELVTDDIYSPN